MRNSAIIRRGPSLVASCAIPTSRGRGWHCADNWRALEARAAAEVAAFPLDVGPFIYPCSSGLAAEARFVDLSQPPKAPAGPVGVPGARCEVEAAQ